MKKILIFSTILIITIVGLDFFTKSGIYFMLDSIFYPINNFNDFFSQSIYWHLRDFLNITFSYEIYSKLLLIGTLLTGAFFGYKLAQFIKNFFNIENKLNNELLSIGTISFVLLNPFTYERIVTQIGIILAIFLIGLGVIYLLDFLFFSDNKIVKKSNLEFPPDKGGRGLYFASIFFGLAFTIMPHTIMFIFIIFLITLIFFYKKFSIKIIFISIFIFLFLNINWLIGSIFLEENKTLNTVNSIKTFNTLNIDAFTTNSLIGGVDFTNALLYGFWPEKYKNRLLIPENSWWVVAGLIILGIIIYGFIKLYKRDKKLSLYLLSLAIIGLILGSSVSSSLFGWFNELLYKYIPYYIGMREPQKFTGLSMIIYALFFGIGIYYILENFRKKEVFKKYLTISGVFILIVIWSPNILFAMNGWLKIGNYPKEIFVAKDFLQKNKLDNILILPWHSYTACAWTDGKVIANPIKNILKPINSISSDNIEIENLYSNSKNSRSIKIEEFLKTKNFDILKNLDINTIYFTDYCADYPKYKFLEKSKKLNLLFKSRFVKIYKLK